MPVLSADLNGGTVHREAADRGVAGVKQHWLRGSKAKR